MNKEFTTTFTVKGTVFMMDIRHSDSDGWRIYCSCDQKNLICDHCYKILSGDLSIWETKEAEEIAQILPELRKDTARTISKELARPAERIRVIRTAPSRIARDNDYSSNVRLDKNGNPMPPANDIFTQPVPYITFEGKTFCFTGVFAFGSREQCMQETVMKGARALKSLTKSVDFLVVGSAASDDWLYGNFGTKVEAALFRGIPIVSEDAWVEALCRKD